MAKVQKKTIATALGVSPGMVTRYMQRGMPHTTIDEARRWRDENVRHRYTPGKPSAETPAAPPADANAEPDERALRRRLLAAQVANAERQARSEDGERIALAAVARAARSWYQLGLVATAGVGARFEGAVRSHVPDSARADVRRALVTVEQDLLWMLMDALVQCLSREAPEWAAQFRRDFSAEKGAAT